MVWECVFESEEVSDGEGEYGVRECFVAGDGEVSVDVGLGLVAGPGEDGSDCAGF